MSDVIVASTTDDQADVNLAAGLPANGEEETQQTEETVEGTEQETTEVEQEEAETEVEAVAEEEEQKPEVKRPRTGWQKRVDRLTARNYSLEESLEAERAERRALEDRLTKLEQGTAKTTAEPAANQFSKPKPKQADFDDYDKFVDALTDWKIEEKDFKAAQAKAVEAQAAQAEQQKATFGEYNKAVSAFRAEHDDFDEVVGREDLTLPLSVQTAIVGMGKLGPEISYALASDEEACNTLSEIAQTRGDAVALTEFGRWLASNTESEEEAPKPVKRAAAPPKPIKPVGASSTKSSVALDEMEYTDYRRIRQEQEKARFRR